MMSPMSPPKTEHANPRGSYRVLLITNAPTPYRMPLFEELAKQLSDRGSLLRVVFASSHEARRKWAVPLHDAAFDYQILASPKRYRGLFRAVRAFKPDVIIVGGFSIAASKTWLMHHVQRIPYIVWSGSVQARERGDALRRMQRRLIVRDAAAGVAYGSNASDYLVALGMPRERVHIAINTVDTAFFEQQSASVRAREATLAGPTIFTYVGYLTEGKNVGKLLDAILLLNRTGGQFILEIVGDGEQRELLERFVADNGLGDVVRFCGYQQQADLPEFLGRSHCFLYQTDDDIWGLVLVEAMASGLLCMASTNAGATRDLINHEVNGFATNFDDTQAVADRMRWVIDNRASAMQMGERAANLIKERATISDSAKGFVQALASVVSSDENPLDFGDPR